MFNRGIHKKETAWKGLVIGLASGFVATIATSQFQNAWGKISKLKSSGEGSSSSSETASSENSSQSAEERENATEKAASKVAELTDYELSQEDKKKAGMLVHYGFGMVMGGVYGLGMAISNKRRTSPAIPGAVFGTALFLAADEFALPALELSGKPSEAELGTHLYGLASHLVYGMTLEGVRHLTLRLL